MFTEVKFWAAIAAGLIVVIGVAVGLGTIYDRGLANGKAQIQKLGDTDKAQIQQLATTKATQNAADLAAAQKTIQEQHDAYEAKLLAANAGSARLAQQLRNAESAAARSGSVSGDSGGPGGAAPSAASGDGGTDRLSQLTAAALTECTINDDAL